LVAINYDTTSDPNFVAYYAKESESPETRQRFERVRDSALRLIGEFGQGTGPFDVVDIGCGAGTQAMLWAELGHRVRAIDLNEALVAIGRERAEEKGLSIRFDVGTATSLPYEDQSADAVLLPELLEHVPEWEACLREAVRIVRPRGLLYLSTTNLLCPVQQEFTLPAYSWYPYRLKRWCERKSVTTHANWVNYARYPAVNWFSYFGLARWLHQRGFSTLDRFDLIGRRTLSLPARVAIAAIRRFRFVRLLAHMMTPGTTVWAIRVGP
jgi:2-polyprenyl-6-hydroxyphenyl methylase/3-demethylubiquinone-9 3-methyltransferase